MAALIAGETPAVPVKKLREIVHADSLRQIATPIRLMTIDFLTEIVSSKRLALLSAKERIPLRQIREEAIAIRRSAAPHALVNTLNNHRINIIAEFKRKSPSQGVIRDDVVAETVARRYESGGAAAISVLTEENHFNGRLDDLRAVKATVSIPVLRKDFIFDEYQVHESAAAGADALLLIVAALDDQTLVRLVQLAENELGLDALVEVHTRAEMRRAVACSAKLIGVNNRDLKTFEVSLDSSVALAQEAPPDAILVSESGLNSADDLHRLQALGYKGFLIGESLMRAERPDQALRALLGERVQKGKGE